MLRIVFKYKKLSLCNDSEDKEEEGLQRLQRSQEHKDKRQNDRKSTA